MAETQSQVLAQGETPREVDRIREIIFGTQMRDYEQHFQGHQRDLDRLQAELEQLSQQLADQNAEQSKKLQSLRQELRQADNELRDELRQTAQQLSDAKVDRVTLGNLLIELGNQLKGGGRLADVLQALDKTQ